MARQRSAPAPARSASAAAARPKPAASSPAPAAPAAPAHAAPQAQPQAAPASSGGWFSRPAAPAPAPAAAPAPPPAMTQSGSGGGLLSGLVGSVATGMAMGTGSAIAHRAVDSFMGPRETKVVHENAPAPAAPMAAAPMSQEGPCGARVKEFADCMSRNNGDMQACNFFFEAMQACKAESGFRA